MIFMFLALLMLNQKFDQAQASLLAPDLTAGTKRSIKQTCLHGRTLSPCACDPKDQSSKLPRALTVQKIDQAAHSLALCHRVRTIQKINQASSHAPLLYYQKRYQKIDQANLLARAHFVTACVRSERSIKQAPTCPCCLKDQSSHTLPCTLSPRAYNLKDQSSKLPRTLAVLPKEVPKD